MTLETLQTGWNDMPDYHKMIHELLTHLVNKDEQLKKHRDYVENHVWGFGERSFWWLWKLLLEELPGNAKIMEVGVFRGATLSLWGLLMPNANIYGVTPLNSDGVGWESNYLDDIKLIHDEFGVKMPTIVRGKSQEPNVIEFMSGAAPYDLIYIDGGHEKEEALADFNNYGQMVKQGGYLTIDDSCSDMTMPQGYFQGHWTVTYALQEYMKDHADEWEFVTNVVHLRVYKRK